MANVKVAKAGRPRTRDWVGAAIVGPGEVSATRKRGKTTFHVWRCPTRRNIYLVTDTDDLNRVPLPTQVRSVGWVQFKSFPETGQPRIGFSEAEAKHDIAEHGFHLIRITVNTTERVVPPYELPGRKSRPSAA